MSRYLRQNVVGFRGQIKLDLVPSVTAAGYRLLDFGNARKLEQFGSVTLDRPCPAAEGAFPTAPDLWSEATIRLPGQAHRPPSVPDPWLVSFPLKANSAVERLHFQLKITPFGHVGVFPEQLQQWLWLYDHSSKQSVLGGDRPASSEKHRALNLFAYTGGSTMALALGGAAVAHVDASAPAVAWARSNAQLNNLENHPIRWIVEDARKFVQREIKRGNQYDIIVLDPPSYGHGPTGKAWDLANEWEELLTDCLQLLDNSRHARLLWTGHSESPTAKDIVNFIAQTKSWHSDTGRSTLADINGRILDAGYYVQTNSHFD
jgi:23S rRNA (cytosine1962-C5)-methyltransferase